MLTSAQSFRRACAAGTSLLALIGLFAATGSTTSRGALLASLERPAGPATSGARATVLRRPRSFGITVRLSPNRASAKNELVVQLTRRGQPLDGAHVSAVFSMPAMNMWAGLTTALRPAALGSYGALEPVLGMPGTWRIAIDVRPENSSPITFVVDARMPA